MRKHYHLLLTLFVLFLSAGCQSLRNSYENRDYDRVVTQFIQKKKKIRDEDVALFEKAYKAALERDKEKIATLKDINRGDRWEEIFDLYAAINARQNSVLRVLPVYYSDGSKAAIETYDFSAVLEESRQNAALSYYEQGVKLLNSGSKSSIRQSVDYFNASKKFYINYKDVNELTEEALFKGKNYVLLLVDKNPALMLPPSFEQSIVDNVKLTMKDRWVNIDYRQRNDIVYDYVVKLNLYEISLSPDGMKEIYTTEEKTVEDGWQYVLDDKGNVKKDSSGNDIKIPKYRKLSCQIKETRLHKTAQIFGDATVYAAPTKEYLKNQRCTGNSAFDYSFLQISGDRNALSSATLSKLNNPPVNFPGNFEMVERAKAELIRCYQDFIAANYTAFAYVKN